VKMRLLLVSAVLVSSLARVSPGFGADASVPDASRSADASKPTADSGREAGSRTDASQPRSDASGTTLAIGGACAKPSDCPAGVTCLLPSSTKLGGGGPAKGLCTVDCSINGQADCDAVDPGSLCLANGEIGYCFESCIGGDPLPGTTKCKDRPDMACTPASTGDAYCKPTCRGNSDCAPRLCDPVSGLCVDTQTGSKPIGSACDPNAATNDCAGSCLPGGNPPTSDNSMCSAACSIGEPGACDVDPKSTSLPLAACLLAAYPGEGKGDIGGCAQLCSCDNDCLNKSFVCGAVDLATVGRAGMCVPGTDSTGAPVTGISCGAGTGGASGTGGKAGGGRSGSGGSADGGTTPAKKSADSGCGCHVGQSRERSRSGAFVLAALGVAVLRRRRVRAGRRT
jgi:MYXO-CTERM domain-containing protein